MDTISLGTTIAYVLDYNERHPDKRILNGATFGEFEKIKELVEGTARGRYPEIGHGVKRLSEKLGETGYAMQCKGLEFPAYLPDTNPGYPWAIAGGHMSMATHLLLLAERDTSLEYWVKAITQRGLFQVRDDMTGLCKFSSMSPDMLVRLSSTRSALRLRLRSYWRRFAALSSAAYGWSASRASSARNTRCL